MPERNHEVIIDGFVFPDTVTVTLANDEYINSRDYVSKELYESVNDANTAWQTENAKLRELCRDLKFCRGNDCLRCSHGRFCDLRLDERCDELGVVAE